MAVVERYSLASFVERDAFVDIYDQVVAGNEVPEDQCEPVFVPTRPDARPLFFVHEATQEHGDKWLFVVGRYSDDQTIVVQFLGCMNTRSRAYVYAQVLKPGSELPFDGRICQQSTRVIPIDALLARPVEEGHTGSGTVAAVDVPLALPITAASLTSSDTCCLADASFMIYLCAVYAKQKQLEDVSIGGLERTCTFALAHRRDFTIAQLALVVYMAVTPGEYDHMVGPLVDIHRQLYTMSITSHVHAEALFSVHKMELMASDDACDMWLGCVRDNLAGAVQRLRASLVDTEITFDALQAKTPVPPQFAVLYKYLVYLMGKITHSAK